MAFSFNFSGDDIESELDGAAVTASLAEPTGNNAVETPAPTNDAPVAQVKAHDLKEWVRTLCSSYV